MGQMFVVPVEGVKVRDPRPGKPRFLPDRGDRVPRDSYWQRRVAEGVVCRRTGGDR